MEACVSISCLVVSMCFLLDRLMAVNDTELYCKENTEHRTKCVSRTCQGNFICFISNLVRLSDHVGHELR